MEESLLEKVRVELEMVESIYSEDNLVTKQVEESVNHPNSVDIVLKL
jgi:hypothetical protein